MMSHDVFISYSSTDKIIANMLCAKLEQDSIKCWIAPRDIQPSVPYAEGIIDGINACKVFVLVFSSSANNSPNVEREVERAVSKQKIIIPFRIEDIKPTGALEFHLSSPHWLDAITPPVESYIRQLGNSIKLLLNTNNMSNSDSQTEVSAPEKIEWPQSKKETSNMIIKIVCLMGIIVVLIGVIWVFISIAQTNITTRVVVQPSKWQLDPYMLKEANESFMPSIQFAAYVDGREIHATLFNGTQSWTTPTIFSLQKNTNYSFFAEYVVGKKRYKCKDFSITADWKGLKERRLDLQEVKGLPEDDNWIAELGNGVTMELLPVEVGVFNMGSNGSEVKSHYKVHKVILTNPFWIGKYEVTQKQYETVMGNNPSTFKGGDNPVEEVSWNDAMEFCKKLTGREHVSGRLPLDYKYTLPTEAQWEFAARGGSGSRGYRYSGSDNLDSVGWCYENSGNKQLDDIPRDFKKLISNDCKPHLVGLKAPNELGLYDMSGNVFEWCSDFGDSDYYEGGSMTNPVGPPSGFKRVYRGGGWYGDTWDCSLVKRSWISPKFTYKTIGFRLSLQTE
jgi:formylglycine-generating enzyme required for sulfatase activity